MKKKNLERWLFNHEDEIEELEGKVLALEERGMKKKELRVKIENLEWLIAEVIDLNIEAFKHIERLNHALDELKTNPTNE